MKIAIIGSGNVGGSLATAWAKKGHRIYIGARNPEQFKGINLLKNENTTVHTIQEAVQLSDVILLSTPALETIPVTVSLGDTTNKVIIDAMNIVNKQGPVGYTSTAHAILGHTQTKDIVKCFNTTGANNLTNPNYQNISLDTFMAGDSLKAKDIARTLALDIGFAECYDIGGNDKFELMEQFAFFWINLAMFQKMGREIGFKLLKR
ncbi:MAG: NAD(P)-binding domain-containing protein [Leptospira sp.]|nr:NAD(P)-binding domain-containing protein [Leptospira sp.]